jgi:hypothetical protein
MDTRLSRREAASPMDNALDCDQPNAGAFERLLQVQALKDTKQLILYFMLKPTPLSFANTATSSGCDATNRFLSRPALAFE